MGFEAARKQVDVINLGTKSTGVAYVNVEILEPFSSMPC